MFTTSRFVTWPTSISPIRTANLRLSVIDIRTTSSGRLISLNGGRVRSAMFTVLGFWHFTNDFLLIFRIFFSICVFKLKNHTHARTHTKCIQSAGECELRRLFLFRFKIDVQFVSSYARLTLYTISNFRQSQVFFLFAAEVWEVNSADQLMFVCTIQV